MGRIVTGHQPRYYPRLHYLARAQQADAFVIFAAEEPVAHVR